MKLRVLSLLLLLAGSPVAPGTARSWEATPEDLARGQADGMALTSRGRLFVAPRLDPLGGTRAAVGPAQTRALAADAAGTVYVGTGPGGQVLRITGSGESVVHFSVGEPLVTALAVDRSGSLLVATAPGGAIYRVRSDGSGERWCETEERYVWALAVDRSGAVYAGTGERGRILRIGPSGDAEILFDSDESHVVSLTALEDGEILAGGAGRGLVYRIDAEGHALVLHDDELPEVAALATSGAATFAALVGPAPPDRRRPALRLRLPDGVQVGTTDEAVSMLEESTGPTLYGTIEGLPAAGPAAGQRPSGRIVRIGERGAVDVLWTSSTEAPFCLAVDDAGRLIFGTGEPARLYRVEPDGDVARLATLREAQLTGLLRAGRGTAVATSNPAAVYRLLDSSGELALYHSPAFDAGAPARWGSFVWGVEGPPGGAEVYTRTGNSEPPDESWSAWSPAMIDPAGSVVANPDGRFLQWRVRQVGAPDPETRVGPFRVTYEPYNRPPTLERLREVAAGDAPPGSRAYAWSVSDPDGDAFDVRLEFRAAGATAWTVGAVTPVPPLSAEIEPGDAREGRSLWDPSGLPEAEYVVRATVSDAPGNPPGEGREMTAHPELRVVVDRTPPAIEVRPLDGRRMLVRVQDALSPIARLEVLEGTRTRSSARADDGVCDSPQETFRVALPEGGSGGWKVRVTDAVGNATERPLAPTEASAPGG